MQLEVIENILVNAEQQSVFEFLMDPSSRKQIIPLLEDVVFLDEGDLDLGSRYIEISTIAGRRLETTYEVVGIEKYTYLAVATVESIFPIRVNMYLENKGPATKVEIRIQFTLKGIFAMGSGVVRQIVGQQTRNILTKIKSHFE